MDLETQKIFVRSALHFAISGTLNLKKEQLMNIYEECSIMAVGFQEIDSFILAHEKLSQLSYQLSRFDKAISCNNILLSIFHWIGQRKWEAFILSELGNCYHSLGQYDKAVEHHKMSLNIAREIGYKSMEAKLYAKHGNYCCSLGQYDEAVEHYKMSLNIASEIGDKAEDGGVYGNLGNCYRSLGQYDEAVEHDKRSLNIAREIGDKATKARACFNLGNDYYSLGQYDKALEHHEMSLNIAREIGDKAIEAMEHCNLGNCYHSLGQYSEALEHHKMSMKIAREIEDKEIEAKSYTNLGSCYEAVGQYDKAVEHFKMSLNNSRKIGDKATEGNAYTNLGNYYHSLGQYDKAVEHHEMSLNIARELGKKADEGRIYCNLGNYYDSLGQYDKAVEHHKMSLNIARENGDKATEAKTHCNLASCYNSLRQYHEVEQHHKMSLNIAKEVRDKATEAKSYINLGNYYNSLGQYDKAVEHHKMSLNIARENGDRQTEALTYSNLGICYLSLGKYDEALESCKMSLNIAREFGEKATEANAYCKLGTCHYFHGQYEKAVWNLKDGLKRFEEIFQNTPQTDELKISVRETFSNSYRLLVNVLTEQDKTNEALVFCERGRARALVDLMHFKYFLHGYKTEKKLLDFADVPRLVTSLKSTVLYLALMNNCIYIWIIQLNGSIQFQKRSLPVQRKDQYPNEAFAPLSEQINSLISKFRRSCVPIECEDRSLSRLDLQTEIKQIDEKCCPKWCSSGTCCSKEEAGETLSANECHEEISEKGTLFRCIEEKDDDTETSPLQTLHQIILASVQDHIKENKVVIVPEGPLHLVPFAALMDENGRYVSESLRVRIVPSLTTAKMILENEFETNEQMKPLIVGDPDFGSLHRLPGANEEARRVAKLFNTEPLIGEEATKENVFQFIENASLIHIAAHGNMERGEIALARKPTDTNTSTEPKKEDNMLMMADLEHKRLKAKLVVLSCCHSARGKITSEGVVGIARAFIGCGARSVLVALWAISDDATLYFMERFYEHLTQAKSAGESLSEAMAAMRESGIYNDPRYWAPFVFIGDDVSVC